MELVGGPGLRAGVVLAWQQRVERNPQRVRGSVAPVRVLAGGRRGMGLKPPADGKVCPFQLGRDALGDVVVSSRQVVQVLVAGLQVAASPLVEPGLGAAQGRADVLDGPAGEAETDGASTRCEFVVHGVLRSAAAGGCPRGTF